MGHTLFWHKRLFILAQPTRRLGMYLSYAIYFIYSHWKLTVDYHRREGFWYLEIQSTSSGRFVSVARPRNWYLPLYLLFIFKQPNVYDPAGQDATEAFFGLHRYEILEKPQYQRLQIGVIDGEKSVIHGRIAGELSKVPYAEPTWLSIGYYSPYYSEVKVKLIARKSWTNSSLFFPGTPEIPIGYSSFLRWSCLWWCYRTAPLSPHFSEG